MFKPNENFQENVNFSGLNLYLNYPNKKMETENEETKITTHLFPEKRQNEQNITVNSLLKSKYQQSD